MYETGESLRLDENGIETATAGTFRFLQHLGMLADAPVPTQATVVCRRHTWFRAKFAGLFRTHMRTGQYIEKGQEYGIIADPYGEMAVRLVTPVSGYIIGLNHMPVVNQGDALLHIGVPEVS